MIISHFHIGMDAFGYFTGRAQSEMQEGFPVLMLFVIDTSQSSKMKKEGTKQHLPNTCGK